MTKSINYSRASETGTGAEIVFIQAGINGFNELIAAIRAGAEIHLLDAGADGVMQIAAVLAGRTGISAVHILSHGSEGALTLGSMTLSAENLAAYDVALSAIGASLGDGADILLYGCNIGRGEAGAHFLELLSEKTGADLAASTDNTGAAALGANWILERQTGPIETHTALAGGAADFLGILAVPADENFNAATITDNGVGVPGANTIGGFVFEGHRTDPGTVATAVVDNVAFTVSIGSGRALWFNYGAIYTADYWQFRSSSQTNNFQLNSFAIQSASGGYSDVFTIAGYDNDVLVISATVDLTAGGSYGSISYTKLGAAVGGTLAFGSGWGAVDTIRFSGEVGHPFGTYFGIDDIDITPAPLTVAISMADTALKAGETSLVTFTFSEPVTGFTNADLSAIDNGALSAVSSADGGTTFTATFTPTAGIADSSNVITLNMALVNTAGSGAPGSGSTSSANYTVDTAPPTATIGLSDSALIVGETATVTITFSEPVTGFTNADLTVANGTLSAVSSGDGGTTWTATFTPVASVTDATNVITLNNTGVADAAGNAGTGTTGSANYAIDTQRPTVGGIVLSDSALLAGETATVTIMFSEAVTGLTLADLAVGGGNVSALASADGGITWTATFTPAAATVSATNAITLAGAGVADLAGNAGTGTDSSANYTVNTLRPTATVSMADTALIAGETSLVTITFSEAVTGFTVADLTIPNGTLGTLGTADNIIWTATFTPTAGVTDATNLIVLDNTGVANAAGNTGAGSTSSANYTIDTAPPTATIGLSDSALIVGDTAIVTITFSEPVTGFTNADLTVANGTLGSLSTSDGGITWTALFTPAGGLSDATNVISLDNTGVTDVAGNVGTGSTDSANYAIDTQRPTVSGIVLSDSALLAGETATVTITFSEAVTGFTLADLAVSGGNLSALATADSGVTWTATFTPAAGTAGATNAITLAGAGVADLAGNVGTGTSSSANYTVDTVRPTATVTLADSALIAGESTTVTIVFSQAVSGLTSADLSAPNGTLGAPSSSDGITWTATFTPDANVTDATNVIALDNTGIASAAGNTGLGSTSSANYSIDTARPGASIVVAQATLGVGQTSLVTITFTEAVTGFSNADLVFSGVTLSPVTSGDGGLTWTATLTPDAGTYGSSAIQLATAGVLDLAGNAGNTVVVSNSFLVATAPPPLPGPPVVLIDGAPSTSVVATDPITGLRTLTLTVPIIIALDPDPLTGKPGIADIPLGITAPPGAPHTDLLVGLPVGAGLQAVGPTTLLTNAQALADLVKRVEAHTDPLTTERLDMSWQAGAFLGSLPGDVVLETRTLTLSSGPDFPLGQPIVITGSSGTPAPGAHNTSAIALVIDTTWLASGIVLQLDNVDFAGIAGAATIRGGAGSNHVAGDDAAQDIALGPGQDILAGGGGNDLLAGGAGNDLLDGGPGDDVLQGGRSDRGAWEFFIDGAGVLKARHALGQFGPGTMETVAIGELDKGVAGLGFSTAKASQLTDLALLYRAAFGRAPDLGGLDFYARNFTTAQAVAKSFLASDEWAALGNDALGDRAFVNKMYLQVLGRSPDDSGLAFWLGALGGKGGAPASRADVLTGFALSAEHRTLAAAGHEMVIGKTFLDRESGWFAGSGDDRLQGGPGSDLIVGGDGIDTVVYSGRQSDYRVLLASDGKIKVQDKANGDLDTLSGIEKGEFSNGTIDLAFTQDSAQSLQAIGMMYQVMFDRPADPGGIAFWAGAHLGTARLAADFAASPEFKARYDALDSAHFVTGLLGNIGLNTTTAGGAAYWENYLGSHTRTELVVALIGDAAVVQAQFAGQGLWLM